MLFCLSPPPRENTLERGCQNPYFCCSNSFEQVCHLTASEKGIDTKKSLLSPTRATKIIYCRQGSEYALPSFLFLPFCFANKRDLKTVARATSNCIIASSSKSSSLLLSYKRITMFPVHSQSQKIMESKERWAKAGGIKRNSIPFRNPKTWLSHFFIRLK